MKTMGYQAFVAAMLMASAVMAQQAGFTRVALQTQDLSAPGRVAVQARAEFDPGVAAGRHTHPGEELGYVLEGQLELRIDGQAPRIVKAGETFDLVASARDALGQLRENGLLHGNIVEIGVSRLALGIRDGESAPVGAPAGKTGDDVKGQLF